jgi:2-C-methyl-D-erythritol 4-phosphate cytidylyltransferase
LEAVAIIAAAGAGLRMKSFSRKQYLVLEGIPVLARSVRLFYDHPAFTEIIVVIPPGDDKFVRELLRPYFSLDRLKLVEGGSSRQESVGNGLKAISAEAAKMIAVHDAARPLATPGLLALLLDSAANWGAAIPVVQLSDTLKEVDAAGFVQATPAREKWRLVQTPQVFKRDLLEKAYQTFQGAGGKATDDAALVELLGEPVITVPGEQSNLKITSPLDLILASLMLKGAGSG